MEDRERQQFLGEVGAANGVVTSGVRRDGKYSAAANLAVLLARISAIGLAAWFMIQGKITLGTVMAFLGYVGGLFGPVQGLSTIYQTVRRASVSIEEISSILEVEEQVVDAPDAQAIN